MRQPAGAYRVAIPSYQRPGALQERSLRTLLDGGVDPGRIVVFCHDYDPALSDYRQLADQVGFQVVVTDRRGITAQRTGIAAYFPAGTPVLNVDDDVTGLEQALDAKTLRPVTDIDQLARDMFTNTAGRDLWVWGLAPVVNAYFMKPDTITEGLKFLIFTFWGCFSRPGHPVHEFTVPYKDEHELSLRAWWYDGATVRHDGVAARANFYTLPGGCQAAGRDHAQIVASVDSLLAQWPGLVRLNTRRKSEHPEIVLASKRRHRGHAPDTPVPGAQPVSV